MNKIITNVALDPKAIQEIEKTLGITLDVSTTKAELPRAWNKYFRQWWGDFNWMRSQFPKGCRIRCFVTSKAQLRAKEITSHIGMYDMTDSDGVLDFYIGLPTKLSAKAKRNGFTTELGRIFCHEWCHGKEQERGYKDRTHVMDDAGLLKELIGEHLIADKKDRQISLLTMIRDFWRAYRKPVDNPSPRFDQEYPVSQEYGVKNSAYKLTGRHIGRDYACPIGTPIYAPLDCNVFETGTTKDLGNYAFVEYTFNGETYVDRILHLDKKPTVRKVKQDDIIAVSGNTGFSDGPHCHIDTWVERIQISEINKYNWNTLTVNPDHLYA